jgi:hypothetical protein
MLLAGEAGSEAIIPLKQGGIPVSLDAGGRLVSRLPSGLTIPLSPMPRMAEGGMVGEWVAPQGVAAGRPGGAVDGRARYAAERPGPLVQMTVVTPDASGFRASQSQIITQMGQQLRREMARNG